MGGIYVDFSVVNQLNSPALNSNTFANRPSAGQAGRLFISTDTFEIYRDNGATWDLIGGPGTSTITGTGTPGTLPIFTAAQAIGDSSLIEGSTKFTTTKDFQADAIYLNSMTLGSGALYYSGNRLTLANYNAGGDVMIEANGGAFAQFISGTDLSTTFYGNIIRNGGLSTQFLKADGSLDSNTYLTSNIYTADGTLAAARTVNLNNHNLRFEGAANTARVRISANNNVPRIFSFATADSARWAFRVDGNETGSNAGANFELRRYNDAGSYVSSPIIVNRASGHVGIGGGLQQLETFNVTGSSLFSHSYTQGNDFNRKGVFAFLNTTTNAGAGFTNGYNYNALSGLHWDNFSASTTIPNGVTIGGTYSGAQVGFDTINTTVTLAQGSGGGLRTFSGVISQIGIAAPTTGGVVTHASGFQALAPYYIGANLPTITNYFGVAINDSTEYSSVAITNRWGIYQNGATDRNYFNGNTLIGSNVDNGNKLQVTGNGYFSGNVGIGTASPAYRLDVAGTTARINNNTTSSGTSSATLMFSHIDGNGNPRDLATIVAAGGGNGGYGNLIFSNAFNASLVERMRIDFNGNLGLGVTPSAWGSSTGLQVGSWASLSSANAYGTGIGFNTFYNGTNHIYTFSNFASMLQQSGGEFRFYNASAGTAGNAITFTQAMTLNASGNLNVGNITSGNFRIFGYQNASTGTSSALVIRQDGSDDIARFNYLGSDVTTIKSNGNVLIGTTTDAGRKLNVSGDIQGSVDLYLSRTGFSPAIVLSQSQLRFVDQASGYAFSMDVLNSGTQFSGFIKTEAPTGGTAANWKLGTVATVSPTSPNRTIQVEINGTTYYIAAKTTND